MREGIRVLIVDDQARTRQSLTALLATWPHISGIQQAANGSEAVHMVEQSQPDVILMDARMPDMDGVETTRIVKARWPQVKVVVLSMYADYRADALSAGADAFVSKGDSPESLLAVMRSLA
jgi:DNA-binding NarL/FixJ family response regulator